MLQAREQACPTHSRGALQRSCRHRKQTEPSAGLGKFAGIDAVYCYNYALNNGGAWKVCRIFRRALARFGKWREKHLQAIPNQCLIFVDRVQSAQAQASLGQEPAIHATEDCSALCLTRSLCFPYSRQPQQCLRFPYSRQPQRCSKQRAATAPSAVKHMQRLPG